jgi:hypothetical protein
MRYTEQQRKEIAAQAKGKVVESLEWEADAGGYWVMTFTDESEVAFRFMAELS